MHPVDDNGSSWYEAPQGEPTLSAVVADLKLPYF